MATSRRNVEQGTIAPRARGEFLALARMAPLTRCGFAAQRCTARTDEDR